MSHELDAFSKITAAELLARVEQTSPAVLDTLPYGVIHLEPDPFVQEPPPGAGGALGG